MTDLEPPERTRLMKAVFATEAVLRALLDPDKINLASLGNVTAHLHWHVIPRHQRDRHFRTRSGAEPTRADAPRRRSRPWRACSRTEAQNWTDP